MRNRYGRHDIAWWNSWSCVAFSLFAFWYIFGINVRGDVWAGVHEGTTRINNPSEIRVGDIAVSQGRHMGIYVGGGNFYHSNVPAGQSNRVQRGGGFGHTIDWIIRANNYDEVNQHLRSADIPNGVYTIQSRSTGRFIDIRDGSTGNGAVAQIWERATINQSFRLQRQDDHTYSITAVHSGKVLEVVNVSTESGAMIQQWEWVANTNNNQRWYIIDVGGGYYKFVNKHSRLVLDVVGGVNANGTRLQQYSDNGTHAQHFRLLAPLPATSADIADGVYAIQSRSTSRFIDIRDAGTGNGAIAQIWERDYNAQNQLFRLQRQSDSSYSITAIHSGRVLDVVDGNINARATIQQWQWTGNNAQRWYIVDVGGGYYKFIAKHSGLALDIAYGVNANGTRLQQFTDNGTPAQQFRFVPHIVSCECGDCEECGIITVLCECGDCEECGFVPDNLYISSLDFIENGGWLEIRNPTDSALSFKGLYLSNDGDDLLMWQMPAVIVRAGETVRVRASGNDVCVALKRMTANFDFSVGDTLYLSDVNGEILFEILVE
jgi:hypothetical protein